MAACARHSMLGAGFQKSENWNLENNPGGKEQGSDQATQPETSKQPSSQEGKQTRNPFINIHTYGPVYGPRPACAATCQLFST